MTKEWLAWLEKILLECPPSTSAWSARPCQSPVRMALARLFQPRVPGAACGLSSCLEPNPRPNPEPQPHPNNPEPRVWVFQLTQMWEQPFWGPVRMALPWLSQPQCPWSSWAVLSPSLGLTLTLTLTPYPKHYPNPSPNHYPIPTPFQMSSSWNVHPDFRSTPSPFGEH